MKRKLSKESNAERKCIRLFTPRISATLPACYVLAFRMDDGSFIIYGSDALGLVGMDWSVDYTDEPIPKILLARPKEAFESILNGGRGIALARKCKDASSWREWELYATVAKPSDIEKIYDD
jgi:hypothetical protein